MAEFTDVDVEQADVERIKLETNDIEDADPEVDRVLVYLDPETDGLASMDPLYVSFKPRKTVRNEKKVDGVPVEAEEDVPLTTTELKEHEDFSQFIEAAQGLQAGEEYTLTGTVTEVQDDGRTNYFMRSCTDDDGEAYIQQAE